MTGVYVKKLHENDSEDLEDVVNQWIEKLSDGFEIVHISYAIASNEDGSWCSCLILYKKRG